MLVLVGNGFIFVVYCCDYCMYMVINMFVISYILVEFVFVVNGIFIYGLSFICFKVVGGNLCILVGIVNMFLFFVFVFSLVVIFVDCYYVVVK